MIICGVHLSQLSKRHLHDGSITHPIFYDVEIVLTVMIPLKDLLFCVFTPLYIFEQITTINIILIFIGTKHNTNI